MDKGKKRTDGFTLIELMIVVAIIGLLAAIAIPQYQQYVAKSQVSEAESMLRDMRQDIELHISREGEFPAAKSDIRLRRRPDSGTMVISTNLSRTGSSTGTINAVFGSNVSPMLSGRKLVYERVSGGAWSCVPPSAGATDVAKELLPDGCY